MLGLIFGAKIPMIIGGVMLAAGSFYTWLKIHDYNLRQEIIAEFNLAQEKLLEEKKAEFAKQLENLNAEADNLRKELGDKNQSIQNLTEDIEKSMTATDGKDPAAKYIKEVVTKMQRSFGEKSK